ncbi:hypothetical protein [Plantibacter cousiniae (nom. nud.)]|uniref:DUF3618 domain-containing protein n=1 Tax=Plantibacter cousiniae (nom. nud.) TaxID=199709 RepID=A0ABY1LKL2_9MICO|nr:hypothetical protein [Plantibacter cousiniae]SKC42583.1 hypothetical protein SAMN06295973_0827 [Plantibacter cousiniae]
MTDIDSPSTGHGGAVDTAREQAGDLAASAKASAGDVAGTAKDAAAQVAGEARRQAKDLLHESRSELVEQAGQQQQRVAAGLRSLGEELGGMARSSEQPGIAADLVSQAAGRADAVASWLDARDPGSLLNEVKDFARRSPGTFIGLAALAGVVAGRLTKNLAAEAKESGPSKTRPSSSAPSADTPSATAARPAEADADVELAPAGVPIVPSPSAGPNVGEPVGDATSPVGDASSPVGGATGRVGETTNQFGSDDLAVGGTWTGDAGVGDTEGTRP